MTEPARGRTRQALASVAGAVERVACPSRDPHRTAAPNDSTERRARTPTAPPAGPAQIGIDVLEARPSAAGWRCDTWPLRGLTTTADECGVCRSSFTS
jgi:hypothetical protein